MSSSMWVKITVISFFQSITDISPSHWNVRKSALFILLCVPPQGLECPEVICQSPGFPSRSSWSFQICHFCNFNVLLSIEYTLCRKLSQKSANFTTYMSILSLSSFWDDLAWETSLSFSFLKLSRTASIFSIGLGFSLNSNFQLLNSAKPRDFGFSLLCPQSENCHQAEILSDIRAYHLFSFS